jgi:S1-C subfamily serine protease
MVCHDFSISPGTRGVLILYAHQKTRPRGLKTGDAILTVSGASITQTRDLINAISRAVKKKETAIKIDVLRDGKVTPVIFPLFKET